MHNINILSNAAANPHAPSAPSTKGGKGDSPALRKAFDQFVGHTFYGQMLQAMRKTQGKPAYMYGGQAEKMFTQQLDQALTQKLSETSASKLSGPMYSLFTQSRK